LNHPSKPQKHQIFPLFALSRSIYLKSQLTIYFYHFILETILRGIKKAITAEILKHNPENVLDVCCGTGAQLKLISSRGIPGIGIDLDKAMIKFAARKNPPASFLVADALSLPFKEASFSLILISFALHDKPEKTRIQIMEEAKRTLQPGGHILILDFENPWNKHSRVGAILRTMIEILAGREHFRNGRDFLKRGGLTDFIRRHGFQAEHRRRFPLAGSVLISARKS